MDRTATSAEPPALPARSALWLSMLGPPVLWLIQFQTIYTLVGWACATGRHAVIPITRAVSLVVGAGLAGMTLRQWRHLAPAASLAKRERTELMLHLGVMMAGLFA